MLSIILSQLTSPVIILILPSALAFGYILYQCFFSPLANVPGPLSAKLTRLWLVRKTIGGNLHRDLIRLHSTYGSLVRIAPDEISVADPTAFKKIYGAGNNFRKSDWYGALQGCRKFDLFAERIEHIHASNRRLVGRVYSLDTIKSYEPYVDDSIKDFLGKLGELQRTSIDFGKWLQLFAFDVIGEVTFARRFGFMDAREEDGIFTRINRSVASGVWLAHVPWVLHIHNHFIMPLFGNWLAINDRDGTIRDYTTREVKNRLARGSDRPDILGRLYEIHREKPKAMDESNIISTVSENMVWNLKRGGVASNSYANDRYTYSGAGSDTTAISLRAIFHFLVTHPDMKTKLFAEIDAAAAAGRLSNPVTFDQARELPYLQAVMHEGMRLYPAIATTLPRVVPPEGLYLNAGKRGELFAPKGTIVGSSAWVIHRNKEIYGEDADEFKPERWLDAANHGHLQRFFFSFGGGSRTCIGRNISWLEMSKLIPTLFLHYDMALTYPDQPLHEYCSFFVLQTGLYMTLTPRSRAVHAANESQPLDGDTTKSVLSI